jgi:diacylglycerol kinase family enzyme
LATALIINLHAGGFREDVGLSARIERLASGRARIWAPDGRDDLNRACTEIAARGPDRVVLCGGDGTFAAAVTALWDAYGKRPLPHLVLAPAGTVCTIARPFVGRASPLRCVRSALESIAPRFVSQPTLRVTDGSGRVFIGFTVGTGLVANFFAHYEASGNKGRGSAARVLLSVALGSVIASHFAGTILSPVPCEVAVDGTKLPESSFSLVVASVLRNLGLSMRVTYRAGEDPHRPHVVASSLGARRLGPRVWRALLGLPLGGPGGFDDLVTTLSVKFPADGPYVLDGDRLLSSEITVTAGPMLSIMTL